MGIFSKSWEEEQKEELKRSKEEESKTKEALQILGVDFDSYSDEEIKEINKKNLKEIKTNFLLSNINELSVSLQMDAYKNASLIRLSTIVYQNWVLIRQNELMTRYLKKMCDGLKRQD
jgi:ribosome-binding ATPase YchF (GTP1/OBG family)